MFSTLPSATVPAGVPEAGPEGRTESMVRALRAARAAAAADSSMHRRYDRYTSLQQLPSFIIRMLMQAPWRVDANWMERGPDGERAAWQQVVPVDGNSLFFIVADFFRSMRALCAGDFEDGRRAPVRTALDATRAHVSAVLRAEGLVKSRPLEKTKWAAFWRLDFGVLELRDLLRELVMKPDAARDNYLAVNMASRTVARARLKELDLGLDSRSGGGSGDSDSDSEHDAREQWSGEAEALRTIMEQTEWLDGCEEDSYVTAVSKWNANIDPSVRRKIGSRIIEKVDGEWRYWCDDFALLALEKVFNIRFLTVALGMRLKKGRARKQQRKSPWDESEGEDEGEDPGAWRPARQVGGASVLDGVLAASRAQQRHPAYVYEPGPSHVSDCYPVYKDGAAVRAVTYRPLFYLTTLRHDVGGRSHWNKLVFRRGFQQRGAATARWCGRWYHVEGALPQQMRMLAARDARTASEAYTTLEHDTLEYEEEVVRDGWIRAESEVLAPGTTGRVPDKAEEEEYVMRATLLASSLNT